MITAIVKSLEPFLSSKCYFDCFGGLVRTLEMPIITRSDQGKGKPKTTLIRFPISCDKLDQCEPGKPYTEMLPSDKYKSLIYFEQIGAVQSVVTSISEGFPKEEVKSYRSSVRLVMWYNMKKLGYASCSIVDDVSNDLLPSLRQSYSLDAPFKVIRIDWTPQRIFLNDIDTIFGRYSYANLSMPLGFIPYEYFAVELNVEWSIHKDCVLLQPFECKAEIPC